MLYWNLLQSDRDSIWNKKMYQISTNMRFNFQLMVTVMRITISNGNVAKYNYEKN